MYTNPLAIGLRDFLRNIGLLGLIQRSSLYRLLNSSYEKQFKRAFLSSIQSGMTVWDIGANVGYYTKLAADLVGVSGAVHAFEPNPSAFDILKSQTLLLPNVYLYPYAVGSSVGTIPFYVGTDPASPTNSLYSDGSQSTVLSVQLRTLDSCFNLLPPPNVIKIDVEGHELQVLKGASSLLSSSHITHIFIEVHFSILKEMESEQAPNLLVSLLEENGFKVKFTDPSHIHATRIR
ncbi:FkbM family methyltransferase [Synechococcus sp. W4D4]|uniref:FkbM family methyltransferase n=1 Tax=Synechococcus sp. W4D4 TaxID=3392294 RepID=UPI0039EAAC73